MRALRDYAVLAVCFSLITAIYELPAFASEGETPSALAKDPNGWVDLLANCGPELKGWARGPIPPGPDFKPLQPSQWSHDGKSNHLVCRGDGGHEWLRWDEEVGDSIFHVEWRFTKLPDPTKKGYNSGIYTRNSANASAWHQAQTGDASGGYLFGETPGIPGRFNLAKQVSGKPVKPAGEWNTFELTAKGKEISLWVNGTETCKFDSCGQAKGYVGVEAEGYRIEFRNVKLKKL